MKQILVIEPSVYICENNNGESIFYNTYTKKSLYYKSLENNKIAKLLLSNENNYIIAWDNNKTMLHQEFINDIISNNFGFIETVDENRLKPVQLFPLSAVQKSIEITGETYNELIRNNILKHLKEVTIYINAKKKSKSELKLYKQFLYPIYDEEYSELTIAEIKNFVEKVYLSSFEKMNIIGSDLFNYRYLDSLVLYLSSFRINKYYYFEISDLTNVKIDKLLKLCDSYSTVIVTLFYNSVNKNLTNIIRKLESVSLPVIIRCAVSNEAEVDYFKKLMMDSQISIYRFIPYLDNNYDFFKENVFLRFNEVLEVSTDLTNIHTNEYINPFYWGKICLMPDNTVRTDVNSAEIIGYNNNRLSIQESLYKILTSDNNWMLTRSKVESCKNCVIRLLCTPISNYELLTSRFKTCEL